MKEEKRMKKIKRKKKKKIFHLQKNYVIGKIWNQINQILKKKIKN